MKETFSSCNLLISAPIIPSGVTSLSSTFSGCKSLTGTIIINTNNITTTSHGASEGSCYGCFSGVNMNNITLTGEASKETLNLIGSTGNNWTPIE